MSEGVNFIRIPQTSNLREYFQKYQTKAKYIIRKVKRLGNI